MEIPEETQAMLKQERKTTDPKRYCQKHGCDFVQVGKIVGGWEYDCLECRKEAEEKARLKAAILHAHQNLDLPARLKLCNLENYTATTKESKKVKATCQQYINDWPTSGGGLMLGGVGTGKTHLAAAICQAVCDKGISCKMTTVNVIVRDVRSVWGGKKTKVNSWNGESEVTEQDIIDAYCDCGLLVIDEIGSQYGSDSERVIVNEIINNRYESMLPTIAMGNLSLTEVKKVLGERVADRLAHDGFLLIFDWESYRKRLSKPLQNG